MQTLCHLFRVISVLDDFQCQVVWVSAHERRLFKLLHIGNDADYS